jgi:hypothetical protein
MYGPVLRSTTWPTVQCATTTQSRCVTGVACCELPAEQGICHRTVRRTACNGCQRVCAHTTGVGVVLATYLHSVQGPSHNLHTMRVAFLDMPKSTAWQPQPGQKVRQVDCFASFLPLLQQCNRQLRRELSSNSHVRYKSLRSMSDANLLRILSARTLMSLLKTVTSSGSATLIHQPCSKQSSVHLQTLRQQLMC